MSVRSHLFAPLTNTDRPAEVLGLKMASAYLIKKEPMHVWWNKLWGGRGNPVTLFTSAFSKAEVVPRKSENQAFWAKRHYLSLLHVDNMNDTTCSHYYFKIIYKLKFYFINSLHKNPWNTKLTHKTEQLCSVSEDSCCAYYFELSYKEIILSRYLEQSALETDINPHSFHSQHFTLGNMDIFYEITVKQKERKLAGKNYPHTLHPQVTAYFRI